MEETMSKYGEDRVSQIHAQLAELSEKLEETRAALLYAIQYMEAWFPGGRGLAEALVHNKMLERDKPIESDA